MRKYTSLLFDLDDTLLDYSYDEQKAVLKVLSDNDICHSENVIEVYQKFNMWHSIELGNEITAKTIITYNFSQLLKLLQFKGDYEKLTDEFFAIMSNSHTVKSGALKVLKTLSERGYRIYLTSNGFPEFQYKRIKAARLLKYFNGIYISEEIGFQKPSRAFFDYVLRRIPESDRSKVLVIGDAPASDIFGGINSKLDTCLVKSSRICKYNPTYSVSELTDLLDILN